MKNVVFFLQKLVSRRIFLIMKKEIRREHFREKKLSKLFQVRSTPSHVFKGLHTSRTLVSLQGLVVIPLGVSESLSYKKIEAQFFPS